MALDTIPPIVLAPLAGGPATVELAAAVCEAGGLGFLAAAYRTPAEVRAQVHELRSRTGAPFGVNVFVLRPTAVDDEAVEAYVVELRRDAARLGVDVGHPVFDDDSFDAKVALLVEDRPAVVSFTFGCPDGAVIRALQEVGTRVWITVTSEQEARAAIAAGADALVAQGVQAGGHRGSFIDDGGVDALETEPLVRALRSTTDLPIVAAGGVATAGDTRMLLEAGAAAVQAGTAFLLADEAGTHPAHRAALATDRPTALTRAFSGRTARGIVNEFMRAHASAPAAFPHVHFATAPLRAAARAAGDPEAFNLWAGTRHALASSEPAADIVQALTPDERNP